MEDVSLHETELPWFKLLIVKVCSNVEGIPCLMTGHDSVKLWNTEGKTLKCFQLYHKYLKILHAFFLEKVFGLYPGSLEHCIFLISKLWVISL